MFYSKSSFRLIKKSVRNFSIINVSRPFMWINHIMNYDNKVPNKFTFVAVDTIGCGQAVFSQKASL